MALCSIFSPCGVYEKSFHIPDSVASLINLELEFTRIRDSRPCQELVVELEFF
jgi:hypothetical protein